MPTPNTNVGPVAIPAPAGAPNAALQDSMEVALLDFTAFIIKWGIDSYLATQSAPPVVDSAPLANRYTQAPSDVYLGRKLPALFVYWNGKSKRQQYSISQYDRVRDFTVQWVFERVKYVEGVNQFSGLISTVDAALTDFYTWLAHPGYAYGGFSAGTDIRDMFKVRGVEYLGGQEGFLKELPQSSLRKHATAAGKRGESAAEGGIQGGYPCLMGTLRVWEPIGNGSLVDPDDVLRDGILSVTTGGVPVVQRYLPQSDGTEPGTGFPQG